MAAGENTKKVNKPLKNKTTYQLGNKKHHLVARTAFALPDGVDHPHPPDDRDRLNAGVLRDYCTAADLLIAPFYLLITLKIGFILKPDASSSSPTKAFPYAE